MGVNMFRPGNCVSTKDGIGHILFLADYQAVEVKGHPGNLDTIEIQPISAVVLFNDHSANKYLLAKIKMAEQPQKEPSSGSPETVERTILDRESMLQDTLEQGK
jgi:hypothetical protein